MKGFTFADREMLLKQIEQTIDERKRVVLPLEVAEAIERFRRIGCSNADIIYMFASGNDKGNSRFADWSADNFDTLLQALVNGYAIETSPKSPKDTLEDDIYRMIKQWQDTPYGEDMTTTEDELNIARRITEHVKRVYEEQ